MEATHVVRQDVFDPSTGAKRFAAGARVRVIGLGDHFLVWSIPHDPMASPTELAPWMVNRSLTPLPGVASGAR